MTNPAEMNTSSPWWTFLEANGSNTRLDISYDTCCCHNTFGLCDLSWLGIPLNILSDHGREFGSSLFQELYTWLRIANISPYQLSTNGRVWKFRMTLNSSLDASQSHWQKPTRQGRQVDSHMEALAAYLSARHKLGLTVYCRPILKEEADEHIQTYDEFVEFVDHELQKPIRLHVSSLIYQLKGGRSTIRPRV